MVILERLKSLLRDPPPGMAFEISEAGIAAPRGRQDEDSEQSKPAHDLVVVAFQER